MSETAGLHEIKIFDKFKFIVEPVTSKFNLDGVISVGEGGAWRTSGVKRTKEITTIFEKIRQ